MRFKLTLEHTDHSLLPLNYQYKLSAWIYRTLNYGNGEFAEWQHGEGYTSLEMSAIHFLMNMLKKKKQREKIFLNLR